MHVDNDELRKVVQEAIEPFTKRVDDVEAKITAVESTVEGFASTLATCTQAAASAASAAASAANAALEAKQTANTLRDETQKMIASALDIHKTTISSIVDDAIKKGIGAVAGDVDKLKTNDAAQNGAMVVVARALGVEKQLDKDLVASVPPAEAGASSGTLKHSRLVQAIIAIGLFAKVLFDIFAPHR